MDPNSPTDTTSGDMDPEQASMLLFDGHDATAITTFTWSCIERRLAELVTNRLLANNDAGHAQRIPFKARELRGGANQMESIAVLAISCNNYAHAQRLPCELRAAVQVAPIY